MLRRIILSALLLVSTTAFAQKKQLTLEAIYDPDTRVYFSGTVQRDFEWVDDSTFVWPKRNEKDEIVEWRLFDVTKGSQRIVFDRAKLQSALEAEGLSADAAKSAAGSRSLTFNEKKNAIVIEAADDLFVYAFDTGALTRLTSAAGEELLPAFSPDGRKVAFVRNNDLYVVDTNGGRERRLTTDGSPQLLNGILDWVYEEEVYGRGNKNAYWWSPDSRSIAFLQLDETPVPKFTVVDHIPYELRIETQEYPRAGDPNPRAKLFVVPSAGGEPVAMDNSRYAGEFLIVNVAWNKGGSALWYQVQDRQQTWLDLRSAAPATGTSKVVFRDATKAWIDPIGSPMFLADGSFLWQSERSGWRHIYHYRADGTLIRQVTSGEWEVRDLHGVDEKSGLVYFSGTERSPIGQDVYRIRLDGSGLQRISQEDGTHSATFNKPMSAWVDSWNDIRTPTQIRVRRSDGTLSRIVDENRVAALSEFELPRPEFLQVRTRDGFPMEAMIIRPPGFDPSKKYPVFQYLYGGPHAQEVRNAWRGTMMLFNQLLAQQGIIVWMCDNRTASGKGAVSTWPVYKNFGELELRDIEDGIAWLAQQPGVDGSRVALSGWSFGGFMVSYALTHSKAFKAGIAGGSVTDWRDYDSIYTERYMLMPQDNPDGYRKSSPRFAAKDLNGTLLLIHGTIDDNVHMQNTLQFAYELEKNGKQFEMMLYPKSRHGVRDRQLVVHLQRLELEFVKRNLLGK